jgi:glycosyltransferase involved in cell wall biosynthesis
MTADTVGGVFQYALELSRGLAERGIEVTLATLGELPTPAQRRTATAISGLTLNARACPLEWETGPWTELEKAGDWLLDLAARVRPDIIHLNHYCHGMLAWPAPVVMVAHSCVYSWFEAVHGAPPGPDFKQYRDNVAEGLAGADLVVAPSRAMLSMAEKHYGPFAATRVIANGRRASVFRPRPKRARILAAGRLWDEAKNVASLARVAPKLGWPVRLIGQTRRPNGRRTYFANVEQVGPLDTNKLAREYSTAAIYALPARYEPFGLGALEAALAGCALVLGDIASLREIWGEAALYVPPRDTHSLARALNGLIANPGERQSRARRARRRARRYSAARMTHAYIDAYQHLLRSREARDAA